MAAILADVEGGSKMTVHTLFDPIALLFIQEESDSSLEDINTIWDKAELGR